MLVIKLVFVNIPGGKAVYGLFVTKLFSTAGIDLLASLGRCFSCPVVIVYLSFALGGVNNSISTFGVRMPLTIGTAVACTFPLASTINSSLIGALEIKANSFSEALGVYKVVIASGCCYSVEHSFGASTRTKFSLSGDHLGLLFLFRHLVFFLSTTSYLGSPRLFHLPCSLSPFHILPFKKDVPLPLLPSP